MTFRRPAATLTISTLRASCGPRFRLAGGGRLEEDQRHTPYISFDEYYELKLLGHNEELDFNDWSDRGSYMMHALYLRLIERIYRPWSYNQQITWAQMRDMWQAFVRFLGYAEETVDLFRKMLSEGLENNEQLLTLAKSAVFEGWADGELATFRVVGQMRKPRPSGEDYTFWEEHGKEYLPKYEAMLVKLAGQATTEDEDDKARVTSARTTRRRSTSRC